MKPRIDVTVPTTDAGSFSTTLLAPVSRAPIVGSTCQPSGRLASYEALYRGNGIYALQVRKFTSTNCGTGARPVEELRFTVAAGTAVQAPDGAVLTRSPGTSEILRHRPRITINPGAGGYEVRYATGVPVQPDGSLGPNAATAPVFDQNLPTAFAEFTFNAPGTYLVVARAVADQHATPWSTAISVTVLAPFDLVAAPSFPDDRGPRYRLRGRVRERSATGRVTVALARGRRSGRFRTVARPRIRRNGVFSASFTIRRRGVYRLRYSYRENAAVARGSATQQIRIRTVRG